MNYQKNSKRNVTQLLTFLSNRVFIMVRFSPHTIFFGMSNYKKYFKLINVSTVYAGSPGPPQNLKIDNLTSSSCTLVWDPPSFDGGFAIKRYHVERFVEVNSDTNSRSQFTSIKSQRTTQVCRVTHHTYSDLAEGTMYECRVRAENAAGIGTSSDPITFVAITSVASIPHKPGTPSLTVIDKDSVTIKWEAPASDGGAEIAHYVVEVRHLLVLLDRRYC